MPDSLIHDLAIELAHACHNDDPQSYYYRATLYKDSLPFLKDGEFVLVEYRRIKAGGGGVTTTPDVVYAGV